MKSYDPTEYYFMASKKQQVLTQQLKRLSKSGKRANFIVVYYSLALIVYSISTQFFPNLVNAHIIEFASIIMSIVILVYSIVSSNAKYLERAKSIENALITVKDLKRRIADLMDIANPEERKGVFNNIKNEYKELCKDVEFRDDLDFYYAIKYLACQFKISKKRKTKEYLERDLSSYQYSEQEEKRIIDEIKGNLTEVNPKLQKFNIIVRKVLHLILYILPIIIMVFCVISKLLFK